MATLQQKINISAGASGIFALLNLPQVYQLTNQFIPSEWSLIFHTLVYFVFTFLTMGNVQVNTKEKVKNSVYGSLIFFFAASPIVANLLTSLLGTTNPNVILIAQTVIYFLALVGVMYL
jgi:hypothetical protein